MFAMIMKVNRPTLRGSTIESKTEEVIHREEMESFQMWLTWIVQSLIYKINILA